MPSPFSKDLQTARTRTEATTVDSRLTWAIREIERLQRHVDDAFGRVLARDLAGARAALTAARWGTPHPDTDDPDAEKAA
jgi:hypothetical protein